MKRHVFHHWIGRVGLAAALLLLTVPTVGRFIQASAASSPGAAVHGAAHHAAHAARDAARDAAGNPRGPVSAPGDIDCDYCPLLAALVATPLLAFGPSEIPPAITPPVPLDATRVSWLHPTGLGSRGPPLHG